MQCLAQTQGPKVRVNAVLPGLLLTDWVSTYFLRCIGGLRHVDSDNSGATILAGAYSEGAGCLGFEARGMIGEVSSYIEFC